jgi:transcriptional regulator with XRE-family HTH domain
MDLGSYLAQVRNERGYSQRDLAEECGVSAAEICRVESGKRQKPSPTMLRAIADSMVISYPYLMQLAGYLEAPEDGEKSPEPEAVFRDERTGRIVDISSGAREMMKNDAAWANVAFRVSRELNERDRRMLTRLAMEYLQDEEESDPS